MSEVVISSSNNSVDKAINEYHDSTNYSGSSSSISSGNTTDREYTSSVPGVPLKVFQERLRMRAASGSRVGTLTSIPSSPPLDEVETMYNCVVGIPSKIDERRLAALNSWYQILEDLNPRFAIRGKWCCNLRFGIGSMKLIFWGDLGYPLMFLLENYSLG